MNFDLVEVPSYEEFKETLTRALNSNPMNWTRKRPVTNCVNEKGGSVESQILSSGSSGSSQENQSENSPNGASILNPQASSIFRRRQDKGHLGKRSFYPCADVRRKRLKFQI